MKSKKGLSLPVTIILALVVLVLLAFIIAVGMGVFKGKKGDINNSLDAIDNEIGYEDCFEYAVYDGSTVKGSRVVELIESNDVSEKKLTIRVKTLASTDAKDYVNAVKVEGDIYTITGTAEVKAVETKSSPEYINPAGYFYCTALYDKNDVFRGLSFIQK